jgi:hypothetical protein
MIQLLLVGLYSYGDIYAIRRCRRRYFSHLYSYGKRITRLSSGGNSPVITLSTTLAAGPVKSNGAGAFISQAIAFGGAEVSNQ